MTLVHVEDVDRVRVVTFTHPKPTNPFGREMKAAVTQALLAADADDRVDAVVLTGGVDRSFCAGGDFTEVRELVDPDDIEAWIDRIVDLYLTIVDVSKPTVAAIDKHAIGLGFQVALMTDWRLMSTHASLMMPELEHGLGASMASSILTTVAGYGVARQIVLSCQPVSPAAALEARICDEVVERELLLERAVLRAARLGGYPRDCFTATKKVLTAPLRETLVRTREQSKSVHRAAFAARAMDGHIDRVLHRTPVGAAR